jgi:diguanylate cyclase (GGDEF)-like protein/PAS domain S-box-containing protein
LRTLLFLLGWLLCFGTSSANAAETSGTPETLRIGVLAYRGKERALQDWQPHADYLSRRLAPLRFSIVPLTLAEFGPAVAKRRIDLLTTNTGHYVDLETGGTVARIATMRVAGPNGPIDRFGGTVIARAQRTDLNTYADLRGQRLIVPDRTGFGGWQVHLPEARAAGIDLVRDTRDVIEVGSQDQVVAGVLDGTADVGFVRSDLIESLVAAGNLAQDALRVVGQRSTANFPYLHSTQLYPHWPFARLDHVSDELARNLLVALLELTPDHPAARAAGIYGWTLPHNYQSVHDLFLDFRLGPYANLQVRLSDVMGRYGRFVTGLGIATIALLLAALLVTLRANGALRRSKERLKLAAGVFEHAQEGILITDADNLVVDVNNTFLDLSGYRRDEVLGRNPRFLSSGKQDREFYRTMWQALLEHGSWRGEMWNRRKDGSFYVQQTSISVVRKPDGRISHFIGLSSDVSALKESQMRLEHMAYFDALTGLPNRRLLSDRLQQAIANAQRRESLLAICYLDLDGFKPVNDTWGHAAGDSLLIEAAQRLSSCVRGGDTVSRLGGDEFVVLLGNLANLDECEIALERIRDTLAAPFPLPEGEAQLSASIGVTLFPLDGSDPDTLIRHADQAMYGAKQAGRNRFALFDAEHARQPDVHRKTRQDILNGIARDEFLLHYQPKVNMRSGTVYGAEALLRWLHPERGLLRPADFLADIDAVGLQSEVGRWVMQRALQQMATWRAAGLTLAVSVNIDAAQLQAGDFAAQLQALLASQPDVAPDNFELEILETAALDDLTQVSRVIETCRGYGVRFAIDDFGTGYSSLTYLKQLQVGTLKIDQTFVRDMLEDPDDLAIVDGIVGLAASFRRDVIAEGVETIAHGRLLLELGCDAAQGYGIARPMPAEQLPHWIAAWRQPAEWHDITAWPREDLPLLTVEIDHLRWVRQFDEACAIGGERAGRWPSLDPAACRFGQWLGTTGRERYGGLPGFKKLVAAHDALHRCGTSLAQRAANDAAAGLAALDELHACRDRLLSALTVLRREAREWHQRIG